MWEQLKLPYVFERMIAFSIPENDEILIESYDGWHLLKLPPEVSVAHDPEGAEDQCDVDRMLGLEGGAPIMEDSQRGHRLTLELARERLLIHDSGGGLVQEIEFSDLSGDWGYATYSKDAAWLLIGAPYDLYVYRWSDLMANRS